MHNLINNVYIDIDDPPITNVRKSQPEPLVKFDNGKGMSSGYG